METAQDIQFIVAPETEMNNIPFPEKPITGTECAWCVDGRHGHSDKGPQMMGGSLSPVVISAIVNNHTMDEQFVEDNFKTLKDAGYNLGGHTDTHAHGEASGCGFADKLATIVETAILEQEEIKRRILSVLNSNPDIFPDPSIYADSLDTVIALLNNYESKFNLNGKNLINKCETTGAKIVELQGEHAEQAAYLNLKPNTTLDVEQANANGQPVFNLDLWALQQQAKVLGIDELQSTALGLMLYVATEMVLVEAKGNPPLPVLINS